MPDGLRGRHFHLQLEWGPEGLRRLGPQAAVIVIVDVLRFSTAVSVAVERGASVLPFFGQDDDAETYAAQHNAFLARPGRPGFDASLRRSRSGPDRGWSLSPTDLTRLRPGTRLVLPSPNGSALAFAARRHAPGAAVLAGCLRNASAVARAAASRAQDGPVAVIAAGERWSGGDGGDHGAAGHHGAGAGSLRPAVEDLVGAGAVLRALRVAAGVPEARTSPEARAAMAAFDEARDDLHEWLLLSASGCELVARGWGDDVEAAAALDVDALAPVLVGAAFVGTTR